MKYQMGDYGQAMTNQELGAGLLDNIITPDVKASIIAAAKNGAIDGAKYVWNEYKIPIMLVGSAIAITFIVENIANAKILGERK